jgi:crossover junction endodeoxyribonuclease RuvC
VALRAGVIRTSPEEAVPRRLSVIYDELSVVIAETRPDAVAVERVFFNANVRTAMGVGQAAGVVMLAAAQARIATYEYTPTQMKAVVTGTGAADKEQVAYMVRTHLRLADTPSPPDAADALALALCHLWRAHPDGAAGSDASDASDAGMSRRLSSALEAAGPGAQVISRGGRRQAGQRGAASSGDLGEGATGRQGGAGT